MKASDSTNKKNNMKPENIDDLDLAKECIGDLDLYLETVADALSNPPTEEEIRRVEADRDRQFEEMKRNWNK